MKEAFVEQIKRQLLKQKEELLAILMSESEEFNGIAKAMDPKDLADIAADDIDRTTLEALGSQDSRRMRLIDSALSRIKNGRFGVCMRCSKKVPEARLKAIPYALLCIECQSKDEKRKR